MTRTVLVSVFLTALAACATRPEPLPPGSACVVSVVARAPYVVKDANQMRQDLGQTLSRLKRVKRTVAYGDRQAWIVSYTAEDRDDVRSALESSGRWLIVQNTISPLEEVRAFFDRGGPPPTADK
ncbi:MAG TPA: hypothetical protein P5137_02105 [Candidatus Brocadiia bacterium]|nr:hypothetical protein [Candidatus Brocadiia bacterium]